MPNSYTPRKPVDSSPGLGTRVGADNINKINDCYEGNLASVSPSWSAVTVSYRRANRVQVEGEFGDVVGLTGAVEAAVSGNISLKNTLIFELKDLYFLPASACANADADREAYKKGHNDRVIVRAVMAQSIDANSTSSSKVKLAPKVKLVPQNLKVGVDVANARELSEKLEGDKLFYAEQIVTVKTTLTETEEELEVGQATKKLGPCRFSLTGLGDTDDKKYAWSGALVCDDGKKHDMKGFAGEDIKTVTPGEGVTWAVYVVRSGLGKARVQFTRWVVEA